MNRCHRPMHAYVKRRNFLKQAGALGMGIGLAGTLRSIAGAARRAAGSRRKRGANDKLMVAVIGTNGRGMARIECLAGLPSVAIACICHVDERAVASGISATLPADASAGPAFSPADVPVSRAPKERLAQNLRRLDDKELLRLGGRGGDREVTTAIKDIGRDARPTGQRQGSVGGGHHVISSAGQIRPSRSE